MRWTLVNSGRQEQSVDHLRILTHVRSSHLGTGANRTCTKAVGEPRANSRRKSGRTHVHLRQELRGLGDIAQILNEARRRSLGCPIDQDVRRFMEGRFQHDFSEVRVHADASACIVTRALKADACALGSDIYFGLDRYSPHTDQGKRLLAHELTHVVQWKRAGGPRPSLDCIGDAESPFEREADEASRLILTDKPMPRVTPDARACLRCAVTVASSSVSPLAVGGSEVHVEAPLRNPSGNAALFSDERENQRPHAFLTSGRVVSPGQLDRGVAAAASVTLARATPRESCVGWRIGFFQFLRHQVLDAVYRGQTSADGSIFAQFYPENIQRQLCLDLTRGEPGPWYTTATRAYRHVVTDNPFPNDRAPIMLTWDDTPGESILLMLDHTIGGRIVLNFLHSVYFALQFTTVLAAWPPNAPGPTALKYFDWETVWQLTLTRSADINQPWAPSWQQRSKRVVRVGDGVPADPAYAGIRDRFTGRWGGSMPIARNVMWQHRVPAMTYFPDWR